MLSRGKITSWNDDKGYGFILPISGGKQIFIHINAFNNRTQRPIKGQDVTYTVESDKQGRSCVIKATLAGEAQKQKPKGIFSIIISTLFLISVVISVLFTKISPTVLIVYIILSVLTYSAYASDKSAANIGTLRTPENFLHLLSLAGGWPGALIAQQRLRHKTKKESFRFIFWITVVLNCTLYLSLIITS